MSNKCSSITVPPFQYDWLTGNDGKNSGSFHRSSEEAGKHLIISELWKLTKGSQQLLQRKRSPISATYVALSLSRVLSCPPEALWYLWEMTVPFLVSLPREQTGLELFERLIPRTTVEGLLKRHVLMWSHWNYRSHNNHPAKRTQVSNILISWLKQWIAGGENNRLRKELNEQLRALKSASIL